MQRAAVPVVHHPKFKGCCCDRKQLLGTGIGMTLA